MDWTQIILALLGIVGGIDLLRLLFVKQDRHKKEVEAANEELDIARHANELLAEQLKRSHDTIEELNKKMEDKNDVIANQRATIMALFDDMCIHKGCRMRKPHQGQGQKWYDKYRDDPALGADYLSIDTLIKQDRVSRAKLEAKAEETNK